MTAPNEVMITVHYFGLIQAVLPCTTERVTLRAGATMADLFAELDARHGPALAEHLLAPNGEPLPNAVVQLDSRNILHLQGQATPLERDGTLHVVLTPGFIGGG
jgi:hypothetical protein